MGSDRLYKEFLRFFKVFCAPVVRAFLLLLFSYSNFLVYGYCCYVTDCIASELTIKLVGVYVLM